MKAALHNILFSIVLVGAVNFSGKSQQLAHADDSVIIRNRIKKVLMAEAAVYAGGILYLNNIWYKDYASVPFHFYNDNRGWMQMDKAGHMYSAYYESYYGMKALEWAKVSEKKALWYGGMLGIMLQTPIEVLDGLYEGYGFSVGDMIANTAGSMLVIGQELLWGEQRIVMKFSYAATAYPQYRPSYFGESPVRNFFYDYNGHTYWLSVNLKRFMPDQPLPKWLNLAVGFGADGMLAEFENPSFYRGAPLPAFERSRQWYLSVDLDFKSIPVKSKFLKGVLHALNMVKFPAPTLEFQPSKGMKFHAVYF